jgi:hypothetical protein
MSRKSRCNWPTIHRKSTCRRFNNYSYRTGRTWTGGCGWQGFRGCIHHPQLCKLCRRHCPNLTCEPNEWQVPSQFDDKHPWFFRLRWRRCPNSIGKWY